MNEYLGDANKLTPLQRKLIDDLGGEPLETSMDDVEEEDAPLLSDDYEFAKDLSNDE